MSAGAGRQRLTALVLAGRRGPVDPVAAPAGVSHKCLVPVGGVPMLVRVAGALAASRTIGRIAVSIDAPTAVDGLEELASLGADGRLTVLASAETPSLSVRSAAEALESALPMLVTTADHALLSPAIVDRFVDAAIASGAAVAAAVTPEGVIRDAYPDTTRTYLRFRDGRFSGANLFALLEPEAMNAVAFWRRVEQDRKRPWRIVRAFGIGALIRYALGLLTLDEAMQRASDIVGARAAAIRVPIAEAAIDVDKPADLALVERILAARP